LQVKKRCYHWKHLEKCSFRGRGITRKVIDLISCSSSSSSSAIAFSSYHSQKISNINVKREYVGKRHCVHNQIILNKQSKDGMFYFKDDKANNVS
jgi:hypothetical protein